MADAPKKPETDKSEQSEKSVLVDISPEMKRLCIKRLPNGALLLCAGDHPIDGISELVVYACHEGTQITIKANPAYVDFQTISAVPKESIN